MMLVRYHFILTSEGKREIDSGEGFIIKSFTRIIGERTIISTYIYMTILTTTQHFVSS